MLLRSLAYYLNHCITYDYVAQTSHTIAPICNWLHCEKLYRLSRVLKPFNDHAGLYVGRYIFVNNSAASIARELLKPSTNSASLLVSIKKKLFDLSVGFSLGDVTKRTRFRIFDQLRQALRANPMSHFYGLKLFWRLDVLDWPSSMSGTKVMAQKPNFTPKSENCRKCIEFPTGGISNSNNSPLEYASELFQPSKNSGSLVVRTEKNLLRFGFGVFGGCC